MSEVYRQPRCPNEVVQKQVLLESVKLQFTPPKQEKPGTLGKYEETRSRFGLMSQPIDLQGAFSDAFLKIAGSTRARLFSQLHRKRRQFGVDNLFFH